MTVPNVLTIAGSDPSGGAGIQADLKTFGALGVYGGAAITAITVQNTRGVKTMQPVSAELVAQQIDAVVEDGRVGAIKIGMLGDASIAKAVASSIARADVRNIVVDPVIRSTSGHVLLDDAGLSVIRERLLAHALVVTPNLAEAGALLGREAPATLDDMRDAARAIVELGAKCVYLKGGHLSGNTCIDVVFDGEQFLELRAPRIPSRGTHGTGCTLSAAIAAFLARDARPMDAMRRAKAYVTNAIAGASILDVGPGNVPLHHAHAPARIGRLYLVATPRAHMAEDEFVARIRAAIDGGVDVLQLRCKEREALPYVRLADRVGEIARAAGIPFIINDRPDVARATGADGVHLGQNDLPPSQVRAWLSPNAIIGRSSHSPSDADRVVAEGATYFAVGPVWETPTKLGRPAAGLSYVNNVAARDLDLPWFAIGGITLDNVHGVIAAGASRIAVVRAILDADDPAAAAAGFAAALQHAAAEVAC